jgi:4,5-dihydroxyphthalate decarboxylase
VQAGLETPGRRDKFPLNLPDGFPLTSANDETLTAMLADGRLDAVMSARRPSCFVDGHPKVRRLFPDYRAAERDYYRRTGLFPIMHAVGIRRDVLEKNRWLAASVYQAFLRAKGADFWSYGVAANYKTLSTMARYSYEQGLAVRLLAVEEMFAEGNLGETRV